MLFQKKQKEEHQPEEHEKRIHELESELVVTKAALELRKAEIMTLIKLLQDNMIPIPDDFTSFKDETSDGLGIENLFLACNINSSVKDELISFKYAVLSNNALIKASNQQILERLKKLEEQAQNH